MMIYSTKRLVFSKEFLFVFPYLLLLIAGMTVPSDGNHGFFSIKSICFVLTVASLLSYAFIHRLISLTSLRLLLFLTLFFIFLLFWLIISLLNQTNLEMAYDQLKLFVLTVSIVFMTSFLAEEKLLSYQTFVKAMVYSNFTYCLTKVLFVSAVLLHLIDMNFFLKIVGIRFMSMSIYEEIHRLQTSADILTPFLLFFLLLSTRVGVHFPAIFKWLFSAIAGVSILLSFSRVLLFVACLAFLLAWYNTSAWAKFKWVAFILGLFLAIVFTWQSNPFTLIVERRFQSSEVKQSDTTRVEQMRALLKEFYAFPFFGKGIGGYSEDLIRDEKHLHSYETQWVAFLMQFGIIGFILLLIPLGLIAFPFFSRLNPWRFSCVIMFMLWIFSGFFNPFLISLSSGFIYSLFYWTGKNLHKNKDSLIKNSDVLYVA